MIAGYSVKGDTLVLEKPRPWSNHFIPFLGGPNFDISRDGKRLLVPQPQPSEDAKSSLHITFLLNYFDELRRRLPVK